MLNCEKILHSTYSAIHYEYLCVKQYAAGRFRDITRFVKKEPKIICLLFIGVAAQVYQISLLVMFFEIPSSTVLRGGLLFFSGTLFLDYLNKRYFYFERTYSDSLYYFFSNSISSSYHLFRERIPFQDCIERLQQKTVLLPLQQKLLEHSIQAEKSEIRNEIERNESLRAFENDPRPTFLIIRARDDYNEAFKDNKVDQSIIINGNNKAGVEEIKQRFKVVFLDQVRSLEALETRLKKITGQIQMVWILAHGAPTSMRLDKTAKITTENLPTLSAILQEKIAPTANLVLKSCSTAAPIKNGKNIATMLSEILPGRTIWAPKEDSEFLNIDIQPDLSIKAKLYRSKSVLEFLIEKIKNSLCLDPFRPIDCQPDITVQIKTA